MKKLFFFISYSFRQLIKLQNDILELLVALAKKIVHLFKKFLKKPKKWDFPDF